MNNHNDLERELHWLAAIISLRFDAYFTTAQTPTASAASREQAPLAATARTLIDVPPPALVDSQSAWARFVRTHELTFLDRLAVVLALAVHLRPLLFDIFYTKNATFDRRFTEFGGNFGDAGFEPSAETLMFLLDGHSVTSYVTVANALGPDKTLRRRNLLHPTPITPDQPPLKAPLRLTAEALSLITTGQAPPPTTSREFPAERLETQLSWDDLVLPSTTKQRLEEVQTFIEHGPSLMRDWGMASRLRPGYRALFHGPPGTGKTMSAALLGHLTGREVYRIDLSLVVSKYIGETEKKPGARVRPCPKPKLDIVLRRSGRPIWQAQ